MRIDHVIYATADLDEAAVRLEREFGLVAVAGGRHEGLGTHNRIVPLGGGYLELLAVADTGEAAESELGSTLQAGIARASEGLLGWAVAVDDVTPHAARLGTSAMTIRREGMTARITAAAEALKAGFLPFFIERPPGQPDPSSAGDAGGITWIEIAGDPAQLEMWLGGADLPMRVVDGRPGVRAVGIGDRELRSPH